MQSHRADAVRAQLVDRLADLVERPQARDYMVDVAREAVWEGVDPDRVCQITRLDLADLARDRRR